MYTTKLKLQLLIFTGYDNKVLTESANIGPVSYTHLTLSKHTHKAQNKFDLPGVYKLNWSDCNKFYIDQTGRSFKQRYIEHTKALNSTTESTFANHLIEAIHTYKNIDNNMNILHVHIKGRKLDTLEQLEIYKHTKTNKNDILNEQTQFKSHALFEHITPHTHTTSIFRKSIPSPTTRRIVLPAATSEEAL